MTAVEEVYDDLEPDIYDSSLEDMFKVYEHKETGYRIAFPYANDTPEARSMRRLRRRIKHAALHVNYNRFVTLTYRNDALPVQTAHVSKTMHRMRTYYAKMYKGDKKFFPYFYKLEFGEKNGRPHWHVLIKSEFIPEDRMNKWWSHGYHDIERIDDTAKAVVYVTKYMCKTYDLGHMYDMSKVKRRWGCASKLTPPTPPSEYKLALIVSKMFLEEEVVDHNDNLDTQKQAALLESVKVERDKPVIDFQHSDGKVFIIKRAR